MVWRLALLLLALAATVAMPPAGSLAAPAPDEWAVPAAEPTDRVVTIRMEPSSQPQAREGFLAGVAAMDGVRGTLVVTDGEADLVVRWVDELLGGQRLGQHVVGTPRIEIALGDSRCADGWTPYDATTLGRVVAHEIGHALGFAHGDGIMSADLPASYAQPCIHAQGTARLLPLQVLSVGLRTGSPETVNYALDGRGADACITPAGSDAMAGWACGAGGSASLPAGEYRLAIRCISLLGCDVDYRLATRPLG